MRQTREAGFGPFGIGALCDCHAGRWSPAAYTPCRAGILPAEMSPTFQTIILLVASNVFMTLAWYGHLKNLATAPWYLAAVVSWGIALAEYLLQVPANRIGYQQAGFSVGQLKVMQEVITLAVFVPFAMWYLKEPLKLDYLWAALCLVGAVYFIFRSP